MGDPRKHRKKYVTPNHPWERGRIENEKIITKQFGLKNKAEIWKMQSLLKKIKIQAKDLIRRSDDEAKVQQKLLMDRLINMGLIDKPIEVEKILDIPSDAVMNRRLQSIVCKQELAHSMKQARQFIVHGHITIDGQVVNVPSYLVKRGEESKIVFKKGSVLEDADHPERVKEKKDREIKGKDKVAEKIKEDAKPKEETKPKAQVEEPKPKEEVKEAPKEEKVEEKKE